MRTIPRPLSGLLIGAAVLSLAALAALAAPAKTGEWPQWRGPQRNGISQETGLLKSWPPEGPALLWKVPGCGGGYGSLSVSGGRVYGMGYRGPDEVVWCRDTRTGAELWATRTAGSAANVGYNEGPRCTPTLDGRNLYVEGVGGDVACLDMTGRVLWQKNLVRDFGGGVPGWGYTESPLVDGEKVIVTPGGRDATLVALNKLTGDVIWKARVPEGDGAAYSSAITADVDGQREYIQFLGRGVVGILASDGKYLWRYNHPANGTANIATPLYRNGYVFAASAYNTGGGLAKLATAADGSVTATEVYFTNQMQNHHGGMVLVGEYLYGFDGSNLACMNFMTGKQAWSDRSVGKGSLVYADGNFYVRSERGPVALVEANPERYVEKGRFNQPDRSNKDDWSHPVVAGGRLYLRDQDLLLCYDLKGAARQ